MELASVSFIAAIAAAVLSYAFGAAWYMALSKPWLAAVGKTEESMKQERSPMPFIVAFVCQVVIAFFLGGLTAATGTADVFGAVVIALGVWLGFVMTTIAVNHGFQGAPLALTAIDGSHWLGVFVVQAVVLSFVGGWMNG